MVDKEDQSETVLKIFGSFGPAGSLVTLCERICRSYFNFAYFQKDPIETLKLRFEIIVKDYKTAYV